ncbi:MAG: translocation/assembly module TamB [Cyclobacteriaceae bacterium]|nr:translocation/assembly module TamB domain-containing protein [Cyclobacteriaceae bacterium]MCH8516187.1 translocation/assembly module TamB [Cyclobacteriaceae bacterium]
MQSILVRQIESFAYQQTGAKLHLKGVSFSWRASITLKEFEIEDENKAILLAFDQLYVSLGLWPLTQKELQIRQIQLDALQANIYELEDGISNYQFILDRFEPDTLDEKESTEIDWKISLSKFKLSINPTQFQSGSLTLKSQLDELLLSDLFVDLKSSQLSAGRLSLGGMKTVVDLLPVDNEEEVNQPSDESESSPFSFFESLPDWQFHLARLEFADWEVQVNQEDSLYFSDLNFGLKDIRLKPQHLSLLADHLSFKETGMGIGSWEKLDLELNLNPTRAYLKLEKLQAPFLDFDGDAIVFWEDWESFELPNITANLSIGELTINPSLLPLLATLESIPPPLLEGKLSFSGNVSLSRSSVVLQGFNLTHPWLSINNMDLRTRDVFQSPTDMLSVNAENIFVEAPELIRAFQLQNQLDFRAPLDLNLRAAMQRGELAALLNITSNDLGLINLVAKGKTDGEMQARLKWKSSDAGKIVGLKALNELELDAIAHINLGGENFEAPMLKAQFARVNYDTLQFKDLQIHASYTSEEIKATVKHPEEWFKFQTNLIFYPDLEQLIAHLDLQNIQLEKIYKPEPIERVVAKLDLDLQGFDPDSLEGYLFVHQLHFFESEKEKPYRLDSLDFSICRGMDNDFLRLFSKYIDIDISGSYQTEILPVALKKSLQTYYPLYDTASYDSIKVLDLPPQRLDAQIKVKSYPPILTYLMEDFHVADSLVFKAHYNSVNDSIGLATFIDSLRYAEYSVRGVDLKLTTTNQLNIHLSVQDYNQVEHLTLRPIDLQASARGDSVDFSLLLGNENTVDFAYLKGFVGRDSEYKDFFLHFDDSSKLQYQELAWGLKNKSPMIYRPNYLYIDEFIIQNGQQELILHTENEEHTNLYLDLVGVSLEDIGKLFFPDIMLSGDLALDAKIENLFSPEIIAADLSISKLNLSEEYIGDLKADVFKANDDSKALTSGDLRGPSGSLQWDGFYDLNDQGSVLLDLKIQDFQLSPYQTLVDQYVRNLRGEIKAQVNISGTLQDPKYKGQFQFEEGTGAYIRALGTSYKLNNQKFEVSNEEIYFPDFSLVDSLGSKATLSGKILHNNFDDINFDLSLLSKNFRLLNTNRRSNPEFYGQLRTATDLSIKGPLDRVKVSGGLKAERGTEVTFSMISRPEEVLQESFIEFVSTTADSLKLQQESSNDPERIQLSGVILDLDVDIDEQAYCRIYIDPASGEYAEVRGGGSFKLSRTLAGDNNLQGTLQVSEGKYRLRFMDVVTKEFRVRSGSTVSFAGNPEDAILSIKAIYEQDASRYDLIQNEIDLMTADEIRAARRRLPVNVLMTIEGTISAPQLSFDIEIPEETQSMSGSAVTEQLRRIRENESAMLKQVFGLVVLGRFIPPDNNFAAAGGGATDRQIDASVSSFLTNQLSSLTQEYLGGVEVSVEMEARRFDGEGGGIEDRDLGVQLSRNFMNDRLSVSVGGTTAMGGGPGGQTDDTFVFGDMEVNYRITETGSLVARVFQRNRRDLTGEQFIQERGVSLKYTMSFDRVLKSQEIIEQERNEKKYKEKLDEEGKEADPLDLILDDKN